MAIVTGGASGIGKCIAEEFRKKGVKVYVIDKAAGDHYIGDISDKAVLEAFAEKVIHETGGIDYLINNALPLMKGISDCSYEEFQYALAVGVTAPFYLTLPMNLMLLKRFGRRSRLSRSMWLSQTGRSKLYVRFVSQIQV